MSPAFAVFFTAVGVLAGSLGCGCGQAVDLGGTASGLEAGFDAGECPGLAGPTTSAPCVACKAGSDDCQKNGCFNDYLCNVAEKDCKVPGTKCVSQASADSG